MNPQEPVLVTVRCPECGAEQRVGSDRSEWGCTQCKVRIPVEPVADPSA